MGVEIIHHQHDFLCVGRVDIHQFANEGRPILARSMLGDFHITLSYQWLTGQKDLAHPAGFKCVIDSFGVSWLQRQALSFVMEKQFCTFIHTDLRKAGSIGTGVDVQDIFHAPDKCCAGLRGDTPALFQPRLEFVFFSVLRTVSWLTCSV